jgi:O-antigen ligase
MQPNRAACALGFLFIGWFALCRFRNTKREAMAILAFLAMMLLTGSRSGALLAGVIVTLIIMHSWRQSRADGGYVLKVVTIVLCLVGVQIGMHHYAASRSNSVGRTDADLITRMALLLSLKLSTAGSVTDDTSVRERFDAQTVYWDLIAERPVLGHGFGAEVHYMANGPLFLTAHSGAITSAMEYGLCYPIVVWWFVLRFYGKRSRGAVESALGTNSILQCVFGALFIFTINGGLLQARTFYVVWGMFFAVVNCPEYVFAGGTGTEKAKRWERKSDVLRVHYNGRHPDGRAVAKRKISAPLTKGDFEA